MTSFTVDSSSSSFCLRPASVKSRTIRLSCALSSPPSSRVMCRKPSRSSVVSGEQVSFGSRSTMPAAILIACSIRPFGEAGVALTPWMVMTARIRREGLVLQVAGALAVDGVGEIRCKLFQVHLVDAAADFLRPA